MFTEEIEHQNGTKETVALDSMPGNLRTPSKPLEKLLFEAMRMVKEENPDKTSKELGALITAEKLKIAKAFVKEHGMAAACSHPNEVSLEAVEKRRQAGESVQSQPEVSQDDDVIRQRYLVAVCSLGHGEFASLSEEQLEDVASIVPQKRYSFNKFKKSLGA